MEKSDKYPFDYLIVVLFDEDFSVRAVYQYPYSVIPDFFEPEKENMKITFSFSHPE